MANKEQEKRDFEGNRILQVLGCEYDQSKILVVKVNGNQEEYYSSKALEAQSAVDVERLKENTPKPEGFNHENIDVEHFEYILNMGFDNAIDFLNAQGHLRTSAPQVQTGSNCTREQNVVDVEGLKEKAVYWLGANHDPQEISTLSILILFISHLAEQGHLTRKQNAENLTDTPEHVKENGNSLHSIHGLGWALALTDSKLDPVEKEKGAKLFFDEYEEEYHRVIIKAAQSFQALCFTEGS